MTVADIPANATNVKLTEMSSRNEVFLTAGAPTTTVFTTTGKGLEFAPVTHPDELVTQAAALGLSALAVFRTAMQLGNRIRSIAEGIAEPLNVAVTLRVTSRRCG